MSAHLIVAWSLGYLITAFLLVRGAGGRIDKMEAFIAVTLPISWPAIWGINVIYYIKNRGNL